MFMADMLHAYGGTVKLLKGMRGGGGVEQKPKQNSCTRAVLRASFLGTRPRVFPPPPGDRFSAQTTENRHCNWAYPMGSTVKSSNALSSPTKFPHFCSACTVKSLLFRSYFVVLSESPSSLFSLDKDCSLNVPLRSLIIICKRLSKMALVRAKKGLRQEYVMAREDKWDREGTPPPPSPYTPYSMGNSSRVIFRIVIKLPQALRGCFVEVSHD